MTVASEVETELKYEAGAEPPSLHDLPGVAAVDGPHEVKLSAVYFDTADFRLARHGATLRRRTGGHDEGWHLKVPVGGDSRVELRLPLDTGPATNTPPEELAELTFGMVRGAAIRPVALLKTKRQTWRLSGDTAGDVLLAYLRAQYEEIVKQDLRVRRDEPDAVHQMRVAARRLRSALRVYKRLLRETSRLRDDLRWLGRCLAGARDLEVQQEHFQSSLAALPAELVVGPVSARITRHFGPAQAAAGATVTATLGDKRYRRLLDSIDRLLADPPLTGRASRPAAAELPKHTRRAYRRTKRRLETRTLHEARKAAKQYRYALEAAEPAVGKKARKARKRARDLTKVLGEHQDGVVARPVLRELGMQAHLAGENGFTFGLLHERERVRSAEAERGYPRYWKKVRKTKVG